jgi:hypothetical protein
MTEQPPAGKWHGILKALSGLTLTNALVIMLLVAILIPAYFVYRALNDPTILDRFVSNYQEVPSPGTNCIVRMAHVWGGPRTWAIGTGFAFQGSDRWTVSVLLDSEPDTAEIASYCETLNIIVDHMHANGEDTGLP